MVAEADDALMEKFFEAGTLTQEELVAGLRTATLTGKIYPAGLRLGAAQHRRRSRCSTRSSNYLPSPAERPFTANDTKQNAEITRAPNRERPVRRVRLEDGRRSVRRPHHAVPRHDRAR